MKDNIPNTFDVRESGEPGSQPFRIPDVEVGTGQLSAPVTPEITEPGVVVYGGQNGLVHPEVRINPDDVSESYEDQDQFKVKSAVYREGTGYVVTLYPGEVRVWNPAKDADAAVLYSPLINGNEWTEDTEIIIAPGESIYLHVELDPKGQPVTEWTLDPGGDSGSEKLQIDIVTKPTVAADPPEPADSHLSQHYQPPDPQTFGTNGEYYLLVSEFVFGPAVEEIRPVEPSPMSGPVDFVPPLWEGENLGAGAEVYKERDQINDRYLFRSIKGRYGIADNESGDEVLLDFEGETVGDDGTHPGVPVYVDPLGFGIEGPAQFRAIRGRAEYNPQIKVTLAETGGVLADVVQVEGNDFDGSVTAADTVSISVVDGLVTFLAAGGAPGDTYDLNLTVRPLNFEVGLVGGVDGSSENVMSLAGYGSNVVHYWRGGVYVGTTPPAGGDPPGTIFQTVTNMVDVTPP